MPDEEDAGHKLIVPCLPFYYSVAHQPANRVTYIIAFAALGLPRHVWFGQYPYLARGAVWSYEGVLYCIGLLLSGGF